MDYIREAAEYLKAYDDLNVAVENLKVQIGEIQEDLKSVKGISYSDMPKGGGKEHPDDELVNKMFKLRVLKENYVKTAKTVKNMNAALDKLPEAERKIIQLWYIDGVRDTTALRDTGCNSKRDFDRVKGKAIRKFARQLWGVNVIL